MGTVCVKIVEKQLQILNIKGQLFKAGLALTLG